jgi:hypothetical protein
MLRRRRRPGRSSCPDEVVRRARAGDEKPVAPVAGDDVTRGRRRAADPVPCGATRRSRARSRCSEPRRCTPAPRPTQFRSACFPVTPDPVSRIPGPLPEMRFRVLAVVPPIVFDDEPLLTTSPVPFPAWAPERSSPSRSPPTALPSPVWRRTPIRNRVIERPSTLLGPAEMSKPTAPGPPALSIWTSGAPL